MSVRDWITYWTAVIRARRYFRAARRSMRPAPSRARRTTAAVLLATSVVLSAVVVPAAQAATPTCHAVDGRADARCTPGALNPDVTQASIGRTICVPNWTATVRPPTSYTNGLKAQQMLAYGLAGLAPKDVEEDHLISLSAGGSPTSPSNLWPQPRNGSRGASAKDTEEVQTQKDICAGRITLAQGQARLLTDWTHK